MISSTEPTFRLLQTQMRRAVPLPVTSEPKSQQRPFARQLARLCVANSNSLMMQASAVVSWYPTTRHLRPPLMHRAHTGVAACRHLNELSLRDNGIVSMAPLAALTALRSLDLTGNRVAVLEGLDACASAPVTSAGVKRPTYAVPTMPSANHHSGA